MNEKTLETNKVQWEKDLAMRWTEKEWYRLINFYQFCSRNISIQENHFKMFNRWYLTPLRIKKMFPQADGKCWQCGKIEADFMHMWWRCGRLKPFLEGRA